MNIYNFIVLIFDIKVSFRDGLGLYKKLINSFIVGLKDTKSNS